jgi:hypothetical protein
MMFGLSEKINVGLHWGFVAGKFVPGFRGFDLGLGGYVGFANGGDEKLALVEA